MTREERLERCAKEIAEGKNAEDWLNNPLYLKSFVVIKANLIQKFQETKHNDQDLRDEIWRKIQALNWVDDQIKIHVKRGDQAKSTLDRIKNILNINR